MIKSLLAYGFSREDGQAVGNVLSEAQNLIARQQDNYSEMSTFLDELRDIKKQVEVRENQFYRRFGVNSLEQLNAKLSQIERSYSPLLANGYIINQIRQKYDFTKIAHATIEEIGSAVEEAFDQFLTTEREELLEKTFQEMGYTGKGGDAVRSFVQSYFQLDGGRVITSRQTKQGREIVGLGKLIVGYDRKSDTTRGKIQISTEGVAFSSDFRKRIEKGLQSLIQEGKKGEKKSAFDLTREEFRAEVNSLILQTVGGEAQEHLRWVMANKKDFDLNRSIASTTGYLGEIRAAALLRHLQVDEMLYAKYSPKGTGALRSIQTGQEIPIDLVCAGNGFQIKNYTLDDEKVTFSNSMLATTWIDKRMRLSGSLYDILINLFGVYQYNQPFKDLKDRKGNAKADPRGLAEYIQMYNSINEGGNSLFYQLKDIFDARVPSMLKMYENFSVGGDPTFSVEQVYFNTFYWINSKLVPSSVILKQLIEQLEYKAESIIKSEYTIHAPTPGDTFQKKPNLAGTNNMFNMARKIRISYDITIDLSKIV